MNLRKLFIFLALFLIVAYSLYAIPIRSPQIKNFLISHLERKTGKAIRIESVELYPLREARVAGLEISRIGNFDFCSKSATFTFSWLQLIQRGSIGKITLEEIKIYQSEPSLLTSFSNIVSISQKILDLEKVQDVQPQQIFDLLTTPRRQFWDMIEFERGSADLFIQRDHMATKNIEIVGPELKVYGNGVIKKDSTIDYNLKLLFPKEKIEQIPEVFREAVVSNATEEWVKLNLSIKGSMRKPSVSVTREPF